MTILWSFKLAPDTLMALFISFIPVVKLPDPRNQSGQGDSSGTLDIIIEHGDILVLLHKSMSVRHSKVLKVNNGIREKFPTLPDEPFDELIIVLSPQSCSLPTHVKWVREKSVVIGSDI